MYGIDESKANTTYADGFGRFCAIVPTGEYARFLARGLIRIELAKRDYHCSQINVELLRVTEHGTSIYREF